MHIVVLGGGYAGLAAAKLIDRWTDDARVTLVNERDRFVERVLLHQLAAGQRLRDRSLRDLLKGTDVSLVVDRVVGIDADARTVRLAGAQSDLHYDLLVYALGSRADLDTVPGAAEHAHTVADLDGAQRLRDRLRDGAETVAVVGGGLTGLEVATEIAETYPGMKVEMVTGGEFGATLSEKGRAHLHRTFDRLGIDVRDRVRVAKVGPDGLVLEDGGLVRADTVVWSTGFRVPDLARQAGFAVKADGRMVVDDTLRSTSHPEVYGIGDAAAARGSSGQELRMACASGLPTAQAAARAIAARLAGKEPRPLKFGYYQQCISLGRKDGLIQFVHADDSPRKAVLTGRLAARYKDTVIRTVALFQRHPTIPVS
ncbi:NAD(P)/FAD-dependent oxidoreductase [Thermomonospora catenispora]|uniref:NAD(P)/FAD-dependent oxidoreductase n=1 Tax=Thermomonospora catenispora TaxID=2493090 RepID=UPI00158EEE37|nr:FAD-dependent oxidoreductase [Thermomonospora catenispora]